MLKNKFIRSAEPSEMVLEKLYCREYDGLSIVPDNELADFIGQAINRSLAEFYSISGIENFEVFIGVKRKEYNEPLDRENSPPYYLWCRCKAIVPKQAIRSQDKYNAISRKVTGLLQRN